MSKKPKVHFCSEKFECEVWKTDPLHRFVRLCGENMLTYTISGDILTELKYQRYETSSKYYVDVDIYNPNLTFGSPEALEWLKGILKEK